VSHCCRIGLEGGPAANRKFGKTCGAGRTQDKVASGATLGEQFAASSAILAGCAEPRQLAAFKINQPYPDDHADRRDPGGALNLNLR
jgi:hypothetical protein